MVENFSVSFAMIKSREAIAVFIGDIVSFVNSSSPSMILPTIDFFDFIIFYCFAAEICVHDVIFSSFKSFA